MKRLLRVAEISYRSPSEFRKVESIANFIPKLGVLALAALAFIALAGPAVVRNVLGLFDTGPVVAIPRDHWRVLFAEGGDCDPLGLEAADCVASPRNPRLWKSNVRITDPGHNDTVQSFRNKEYWLGARIPAKSLRLALAKQANHILLGYLVAHYEVWIDGTRFTSGSYSENRLPLVLTLPQARLQEPRDIHLAVKLVHDEGSVYPDVMAISQPEGLVTAIQAHSYVQKDIFEDMTRPAFFAGAYLFLAGMFVIMWLANRKKQEHWYMGMYSLIQAIMQMMAMADNAVEILSSTAWYRVQVMFSTFEAAAALYIGFAFARARSVLYAVTFPVLAVAALASPVLLSESTRLIEYLGFLQSWVIPAGYGLGAVACSLQAWALFSSREASAKNSVRARRLLFFAAGLFGIGISYCLEAGAVTSATDYTYWYRFTNLGLVLFISTIALLEYREQEKIIEKTPVSAYHRRPVLPDRISGIMFGVDLKNSESLLRMGARDGNAGTVVHACLTHLWRMVTEQGGTVLQTEGDMLVAFFENNGHDALDKALSASFQIDQELNKLSRQLSARSMLPDNYPGLFFRAAIAPGEIRPVWQEMDNTRYPGWIEAGESNVFVETARLLELERELGSQHPSMSIVVLAEELAAKIEKERAGRVGAWLARALELTGKHGHKYRIAAYSPSDSIATVTPLRGLQKTA